jgi:RHS repeat-associated protein
VTWPNDSSPVDRLRFDYDELGRVERQWRTFEGQDYIVTKAWAAGGYDQSITYPDGETVGSFGYDEAGRLKSIPGIVTDVTYNAAGRPLQKTNAFPNAALTTWTYATDTGKLNRILTTIGGTSVQDLTYTIDDAGLVREVTSPFTGESWSYDYDDLYHLTTATNPTSPPDSQTFTYDAGGRVTYNSRIGTYTYPGIGQPGGQPKAHAPATAGANSYSYDDNGNLTSGGGRAPVWDGDNLISQIGTTQYSYDAFGERLKKTDGGTTSLYPFADDYEITNGVVTKYISVEGLGVVAKRVTSGGQTHTYWLHTDHLGSIQAVTDEAAQVVFRRMYRPYGETQGQNGSHTESRGWIDQRNDTETGLTYLHARYFDPQLGTFLSADPIGIGGGVNLYGYGVGNPVNWTDRSGLQSKCTWTKDDSGRDQCVADIGGVTLAVPGPDTVLAPRPPGTDPAAGDPNGTPGRGPRGGRGNRGSQGNDGNQGSEGGGDGSGPDDGGEEEPPISPEAIKWFLDFVSAIPAAAWGTLTEEQGCGNLFVHATRDALFPFSPSAATAGEPIALALGAQELNTALQYAASRTNYLGGTGLIYPMKSSVFRAGVRSAGLKAASGPLMQADLAIVQGLIVEGAALLSGQCR